MSGFTVVLPSTGGHGSDMHSRGGAVGGGSGGWGSESGLGGDANGGEGGGGGYLSSASNTNLADGSVDGGANVALAGATGGGAAGAKPMETLARGFTKNDNEMIFASLRELVATYADSDQASLQGRGVDVALTEAIAAELVLALEIHAVRGADEETATLTAALYLLTRLRGNRILLAAEDCAAVVSSAIVSCASNPIVAENACGIVRNLACTDELLDGICRAQVVNPILEALSRHRDSPRVVLAGAAAVANLARHVALREDAVDAGAPAVLAGLAKLYGRDHAVLAMMLRSLGNLGACPEARPEFERVGGATLCLDALGPSPDAASTLPRELVEASCQCLSNYMTDPMVAKRVAADPGIVASVAAIIGSSKVGARSADRRVLGAAMCLLRNIAVYDSVGDVKRSIREAGLLQDVISVMRRHNVHVLMQSQGLAFIRMMLSGDGVGTDDLRFNHDIVLGDYGIPVIFSALLTFPGDEVVQLHGLECLHTLCSSGDRATLEIAKSGGGDICNAAIILAQEQVGVSVSEPGAERILEVASALGAHLRNALNLAEKTHE